MSLSAWEQQALDSIEGGLAGSDPELASLLATFARLASGEKMPVRQEIRVLGRHATRRPLRNRRPRRGKVPRTRRLCPRLGWQQTIVLLWLAVTIAVVAVTLVLSRGSGNRPCPEAWAAAACTQQTPAHSPSPDPPPRSARGDPRDPPGLGSARTGLRAAWDAGDPARHYPYRQVDHTRGPAEALSDADRNTTVRSE
ncbi:MAG TPA: hypothetical protein VGS06_32955 [Streptosporangiaceae bacterium]|nr:hypothetical protein [Streptosporangiaceae bacterium]